MLIGRHEGPKPNGQPQNLSFLDARKFNRTALGHRPTLLSAWRRHTPAGNSQPHALKCAMPESYSAAICSTVMPPRYSNSSVTSPR